MFIAHSDSCLLRFYCGAQKISALPVPGVQVKTSSMCSGLHFSKSQSPRQSRSGSAETSTIPEFLTTSYLSPTVYITFVNFGFFQCHSQTFMFGQSRPPS